MTYLYIALGKMLCSTKKYRHFSYFSMKTYVVGTHWKGLGKALPMSTHNIHFCGEIKQYLSGCSFYWKRCVLSHPVTLTCHPLTLSLPRGNRYWRLQEWTRWMDSVPELVSRLSGVIRLCESWHKNNLVKSLTCLSVTSCNLLYLVSGFSRWSSA